MTPKLIEKLEKGKTFCYCVIFVTSIFMVTEILLFGCRGSFSYLSNLMAFAALIVVSIIDIVSQNNTNVAKKINLFNLVACVGASWLLAKEWSQFLESLKF